LQFNKAKGIDLNSLLNLIAISSIGLFIGGCAALGSKATMSDPKAFEQIQTVCLAPVAATIKDEPAKDETRALLYKILARKIDTLHAFIVIANDSLRDLPSPTSVEEARNYGRTYHSNGVLFAQMRYYKPFLDPILNAELTLTLVETETGKTVASCKHDTQWGNSYMSLTPPSMVVVTADAIQGAMEALDKLIKEHRGTKP
jgi:hypothetical protein